MLKSRIQLTKLLTLPGIHLQCRQHVLNLYFSGNSMNNLSSYCGLTVSRMRASDTDLPVLSCKVGPTIYIHIKVHTGKYLCSCKVQPLNDDWVSFPIISHRPQPLKLNFLSSLKWMWNCIFPPLPSYVSSPSSPVLPHSTVLRFIHLCLVRFKMFF